LTDLWQDIRLRERLPPSHLGPEPFPHVDTRLGPLGEQDFKVITIVDTGAKAESGF